ncbi:MAG: hypothetical protein AB7V44_14530 [Pseudonocardia sp.]
MRPARTRRLRVAAELLVLAAVVAAVATGSLYVTESGSFDHPVRGGNAWQNFVAGSILVAVLGTAAGGVLWLAWRRRASLDAQPDAPARLLAVAVATLPQERRDWGTAMAAELSSVTGRAARWRFATGSARAALFPPAGSWRPAAGWAGAGVGVLGVLACLVAAGYLGAAHPDTLAVTPPHVVAVLVVFLVACLTLTLAAPAGLRSSTLARRTGLGLGVAGGVGLLLLSRAGGLEAGALVYTLPALFLVVVIAPVAVAAVARSFRAGVQAALWGFVFCGVTMFPVYLVESVRRFRADGTLYLDGELVTGATAGDNLGDAVGWLLLVVPGLLMPLGILGAALATAVVRAIRVRAARSRRGGPAAG